MFITFQTPIPPPKQLIQALLPALHLLLHFIALLPSEVTGPQLLIRPAIQQQKLGKASYKNTAT